VQNHHFARNSSINPSGLIPRIYPLTMADRVSTKLFIQHPEDAHIKLCGVLEQLSPNQPTSDRKIALVRLFFDVSCS